MADKVTHPGGCLCGQIRFDAQGKPNSVSTCHCNSCQRAGGGDSVAWVEFPLTAVQWTQGNTRQYASSPGVERRFCGNCGSSLSYKIKPDAIDIVLACLDNPEAFTPTKEIWLDHRRSWNTRNPSIPGYRGFSSNGQLVSD